MESASIKWKSGREAVRRLAAGELKEAGWRAGGLPPEKLELVKRLYRDDMSLHEANAVMWYLRNGLFFDLAAGAREDFLLIHYEDLVNLPREGFGRVFDFIGTRMPPQSVEAVRDQRRGARPFPDIAPEIRSLCEALYRQLWAHYTAAKQAVRQDDFPSARPDPSRPS